MVRLAFGSDIEVMGSAVDLAGSHGSGNLAAMVPDEVERLGIASDGAGDGTQLTVPCQHTDVLLAIGPGSNDGQGGIRTEDAEEEVFVTPVDAGGIAIG